MTSQPPPRPQNPIPERRRRPPTGVTFDEMIAIIVAFSTIGAILFWSIGGKNGKFASNFGLNSNNNLLASNKTTATGLDLGFGNILADNTDEDLRLNQDVQVKNRRLAAQLKERDAVIITNVPPNKKLELSPKNNRKSFSLDSGAKLVPLAGGAAIPVLKAKPGRAEVSTKPDTVTPKNRDPDTQPTAVVPEAKEPTVKPKPTAVVPEDKKMPGDIAPDYWAFPFVKQMRDKGLLPEIAKNQEFEPDVLITRASMATLVSQAFSEKPQNENIKKFSDVVKGNALSKDVDQAVSRGFMQGYSDNEFRPLQNIPRYQVLVTLATGLGLKPSKDADQILKKFGDSSNLPDWAKQQVAAAVEAGLVINPPGTALNTLAPDKSATRAEVAAMIHQALVKTGKLQPLKSEYIVKP